MNDKIQGEIEEKIFSAEFYHQNFVTNQDAANYLDISTEDWAIYLKELGESQHQFIISMRIEDVLDHLSGVNPRASLSELASRYGFRSRVHLLWHFYKRQRCTPRQWAFKMGAIL